MLKSKKKILVTGGDGRFAKILKIKNKNLNLYFTSKKNCNILNIKSISNIVKKVKPDIILHTAGLSRPMNIHEKEINKSISLKFENGTNTVILIMSGEAKVENQNFRDKDILIFEREGKQIDLEVSDNFKGLILN